MIKIIKCITIICLVGFVKLTYSVEFKNIEVLGDPKLKGLVLKYYQHESNMDWSETFRLRTDGFKKLVPFKLYEKHMNNAAHGWKLKKIEILSIKHMKTSIIIFIRFSSIRKGVITNYNEHTKWINKDNNWKVFKPGIRDIFLLNEWMVN